jgi:hypothetical protein
MSFKNFHNLKEMVVSDEALNANVKLAKFIGFEKLNRISVWLKKSFGIYKITTSKGTGNNSTIT